MMAAAHADATARAVRFFFDLEIAAVDLVANFQNRVAHRARRMLGDELALMGGQGAVDDFVRILGVHRYPP